MNTYDYVTDVGEGVELRFFVTAETEEVARAELERVRKQGKLFDPARINKFSKPRIIRVDRETALGIQTIYCEGG